MSCIIHRLIASVQMAAFDRFWAVLPTVAKASAGWLAEPQLAEHSAFAHFASEGWSG